MNRRIPLYVLACVIAFTIMPSVASATIWTTQSIDDMPPLTASFTAFDSSVTKFDIMTPNGEYIGQVSDSGTWRSTSNKYPDVEVWASKPFFVSPGGWYYYTPEQYTQTLVDPNNYVVFQDTRTGDLVRLTGGMMAVDVGVRTYTRIRDFDPEFHTIWQRPLEDVSVTRADGTVYKPVYGYGTPSSVYDDSLLDGLILGSVDTNFDIFYFKTERHAAGAKITTALEDYRDVSTMMGNLVSQYRNSPLVVTPTINFKTVDNAVNMTYYKAVAGNTFLIQEQQQMQIMDAELVQALRQSGIVQNAVDRSYQFNYTKVNSTEFGDEVDTDKDELAADDYVTETTRVTGKTASFTYVGTEREDFVSGRVVLPHSITVTGRQGGEIDLDNFKAARQELSVAYPVEVQPFTHVHYATYHMDAMSFKWSGAFWSAYEEYTNIQYDVRYPYRVELDNVYAIYRIKFPVLFKTVGEISYVPATGQPVRVDDIYDFGVNDIGVLNPTLDDLRASTLRIDLPWYHGLELWWETWGDQVMVIIGLVVAATIAIAIITLLVKLPKSAFKNVGRGGSSQQKKKITWPWAR